MTTPRIDAAIKELADILRGAGWTCTPPVLVHYRIVHRTYKDSEWDTAVGSLGGWQERDPDEDRSWRKEWDALPVPARTRNCLTRNGFTVDDVRHTPDKVLRKVRNLGKTGIAEVRAVVPLADTES